jgi:hypothetical protein
MVSVAKSHKFDRDEIDFNKAGRRRQKLESSVALFAVYAYTCAAEEGAG